LGLKSDHNLICFHFSCQNFQRLLCWSVLRNTIQIEFTEMYITTEAGSIEGYRVRCMCAEHQNCPPFTRFHFDQSNISRSVLCFYDQRFFFKKFSEWMEMEFSFIVPLKTCIVAQLCRRVVIAVTPVAARQKVHELLIKFLLSTNKGSLNYDCLSAKSTKHYRLIETLFHEY
jgi:hypothetical protein